MLAQAISPVPTTDDDDIEALAVVVGVLTPSPYFGACVICAEGK
jgi:hypothetical protein